MSWLSLFKALILATVALANWLRQRQALEAATAELVSQHLQIALNEIKRAEDIRNSVRDDIANNPDKLREDDGFKRPK